GQLDVALDISLKKLRLLQPPRFFVLGPERSAGCREVGREAAQFGARLGALEREIFVGGIPARDRLDDRRRFCRLDERLRLGNLLLDFDERWIIRLKVALQ